MKLTRTESTLYSLHALSLFCVTLAVRLSDVCLSKSFSPIATALTRLTEMISQSLLSPNHHPTLLSIATSPSISVLTDRRTFPASFSYSASLKSNILSHQIKFTSSMTSNSSVSDGKIELLNMGFGTSELDGFVQVGNQLADAAGEVIRTYFRKSFDILDKEDMSPVTIADRAAEESMVKIIQANFPSHAIYGEENGWRCKEKFADFVWVLDPIDGTKSFITGKPLFGTLISLLHKGRLVLGIIDQPVLRERWVGIKGRRTMLNGKVVSTRSCPKLSQAYLYTTSPHLFDGDAEVAFTRVRSQVKVPLYGCDCYAYALLASGFVDLVVESGLKPYDFLSLIPVIEGAGGVITDWKGHELNWEASSDSSATGFNVVAAGDRKLHQEAIDALQWQ